MRGKMKNKDVKLLITDFKKKIEQINKDIQMLSDSNLDIKTYNAIFLKYSTHNQVRYFLEALCGTQRPYRESPKMPSLSSLQRNPFIRLSPERNQEKAESKIKFEIPIRPGQFYFSIQELERCYYDTETVLTILDGGRGLRTGLLGLASGSKGSIRLFEKPLFEHIASSYERLREALGPGHLILVSSDDLIELSDNDIEMIRQGIELNDFYYFDLPDSGRFISPFNEADRKAYISNRRFRKTLASFFDLSINEADCIIRHLSYDEPTMDSAETFLYWKESAAWISLLTYGADIHWDGLITPFLFIFSSKEVIRELQKVSETIPEKIRSVLGWHDFLLYGFKMDELCWKTYKPDGITATEWMGCLYAIKNFAEKYDIDIKDKIQCKNRLFRGPYLSFNFASTFIDYIEAMGNKMQVINDSTKNINIFSDRMFNREIDIQTDCDCDIYFQNCHIEGRLEVINLCPMFPLDFYANKTLLYGIELPDNETLTIPIGHCIANVEGDIYSMPLYNPTKVYQGKTRIWKYILQGKKRCPVLSTDDFYKLHINRWQ